MVEEALLCADGNMSSAARMLDIQRRQFQHMMERFGIIAAHFKRPR